MPERAWARLLTLLLACWLALLLPSSARAADQIVSRAWQMDPGGQRAVADLPSQGWHPAPAILPLGYTPDALWLRLTVNVQHVDVPLILRIRPSYLDHVQLHLPDPQHPGQWLVRDTGDTLPFDSRDRASAALGFVWQPQRTGEHTLYLRVSTTSSLLVSVQAVDLREAQFLDARLDGFLVFYLSIMLCMGLWAALDYATQRSSVNLWFIAAQLNSSVVALSVLGHIAILLPAGWSTAGHWVTSVTVCLSTALYIGFYRSMVSDNVPSAASLRAMGLALLLFPLQLIAMAAGHNRLAVESNAMVTMLVALPLLIWTIATACQDGLLKRRTWWAVAAFQTGLTLMSMMPLLGWRPANEISLQSSLSISLSSAALMMTVLMMRSHRTMQAAREDRLRLDMMAQRLDLEQRQRADQHQFLDMLGHELKTPLMTIRLAGHALQQHLIGQSPDIDKRLARIEASADAMNLVLERVLEANRLGEVNLPLTARTFTTGELTHIARAAMPEPERLHCDGPLDLVVHTDPDLLRVILSNLLDNACKYALPGTPITLDVQSHAQGWRLSVRNQAGPTGTPDPDTVFRKYHRAEAARSMAGAGLGLWIGQNLAQRLGGSLGLQSQDDHVTFTVELPLLPPSLRTEPPPS